MILVECKDIKKSFGELEVLKGVNLSISDRDRIGVVGKNGAGKTTLIEILHGDVNPDNGTITKFTNKLSLGYMKQEIISQTLYPDCLSKNFLKAAAELGVKKLDELEGARLISLSGGERAKLALAEVLAKRPQLVILDEPTNHMDFKGIKWLIDAISSYDGAFIIISHDRYFLDATVNKIVEVTNGVTEEYSGNYSYYKDEKKRRFEEKLKDYVLQKKNEDRIQGDIDLLKNWSSKAHRESRKKALETDGVKEYFRAKAKKMDKQIKSQVKKLEKLKTEGITKPEEDKKVFFSFENADKHDSRMLEAKNIKKSFGQKLLFEKSSFTIKYGDRIGIVGPNGCGKTTFIRMLLGLESVDGGDLWLSPSSKPAYLSQDVSDLEADKTVSEVLGIDDLFYNNLERNTLINMGFKNDILSKSINFLSPGEKTKVKLASLILKKNNLLILDEPHNHLDLMSREQLEETLQSYNGTILLVSHDRYMLKKLCSSLLIFRNNQISKLECSIDEYIDGASKPLVKDAKDRLILIENRLSFILGELSSIDKTNARYNDLDKEFNALSAERKTLKAT